MADNEDWSYQEVLDTWFGLPHRDERDDETVVEDLGPYYEPARRGELEEWEDNPRGRLALIILLDQVPRHLFREKPTQYKTDPKAQELADFYFEEGFPEDFSWEEIYYGALPYLHAEDHGKQKKVNPIIKECAENMDDLEFMGAVADAYEETIQQFGRFPSRNELLGRTTTDEEKEFLQES